MKEVTYSISEASRLLEVENHVLRYWEEELALPIPRNEQGHRYYREKDIELLSCIKELKNKGFQLKAVKEVLPELESNRSEQENPVTDPHEADTSAGDAHEDDTSEENRKEKILSFPAQKDQTVLRPAIRNHEEKMQEFETVMGRIVSKALRRQAEEMGEIMGEQICSRMSVTIDDAMNEQARLAEEHYQKLDEAIRMHQKARQEMAASREEGGRKKSRFFRKNKRKI